MQPDISCSDKLLSASNYFPTLSGVRDQHNRLLNAQRAEKWQEWGREEPA